MPSAPWARVCVCGVCVCSLLHMGPAQDNAELFMDEIAANAAREAQLELDRRRAVPGLLPADDFDEL